LGNDARTITPPRAAEAHIHRSGESEFPHATGKVGQGVPE
jgi:hypothetical protein